MKRIEQSVAPRGFGGSMSSLLGVAPQFAAVALVAMAATGALRRAKHFGGPDHERPRERPTTDHQ